MANVGFNKGKYRILEQYINGGSAKTLKVAFMDPAYSVDIDAHHFYSDISASIASGSTDQTLASIALSENDTDNRAELDAADLSVVSETITGGTDQLIIYEDTGTPATSPLLFKIDIVEGTLIPIDGTLAITWSSNGIFAIA